MSFLLLALNMKALLTFVIGPLMLLLGIFLMLLVLIQRGKGGGLSGAFGGMGGQSAFGARAGDTIMWVTVGVAATWILLCVLAVVLMNNDRMSGWGDTSTNTSETPSVSDPSPEEDSAGGEFGEEPSDD